jgi:hypothetical protein
MTTPSPPVTAESLRAELVQKLRQQHIAADTGAAADACLSVVLPRLRAMAGEIDRLRAQVSNSATTIEVLRGQVKDGSEGEERHA